MGLSLRPLGKKIWETLTPQNEAAMRAGEQSITAANQNLQGARYGVLANPAQRQVFVQRNQPSRFNAPAATVGAASDALVGGVKRFGQSVASAGLSGYSNYLADQERQRAERELTPAYENFYRAYGADPRLGANQAQIEAGQIDYSLRTDPLARSNIGVNDSTLTTTRKVGGQAAEAALDIATLGTGTAPEANLAKSAFKSGLLSGGSGLANVAQTDMSPGEAFKVVGLNTALGVALPLATEGLPRVAAKRIPLNEVGAIGRNVDDVPLSEITGVGKNRPGANVQKAIEDALNSGDRKGAQKLVDTIADPDLKAGMQSTLDAVSRPKATAKLTPEENKLVAQIQATEGISKEQAVKRYQAIRQESLAPDQTIPGANPKAITAKPTKLPEVRSLLGDISSARMQSGAEGDLVAATVEQAARRYGIDTSDPEVIHRFQTGQLATPNEKAFAEAVKKETDRIFWMQRAIDPEIQYRQNYLPQQYAEGSEMVQDAARQLQNRTGSAQPRAFETYREAQEFGLTPRYKNIEQMVGSNAAEARRAFANGKAVTKGIESGLLTNAPPDSSWRLVEGFRDSDGAPVYASPKVANTINNAIQENTDLLSKSVRGLGKLNATWQDIMLAGGVPKTPFNFFVLGQTVKELTAGRVSVAKDLGYSLTKGLTQRRFAEQAPFVRDLTKRGVPFNITTQLDNAEHGWLHNVWGDAINRPTFGRFLPNQYLTVAENVFNKAQQKGMSKAAATDLAAETVKRYYGIVDQIAQGRSTNVQNAINAAFFAPRYRETIINTLLNTGRGVTTNIADPAFAMNRRLAAGMAISLVGLELLQREITGHGIADNRKGQEFSLEIPMGEPDEKGNQKTVNIPFMPGFLTLPRAAWEAVTAALDADTAGVVKAGSKVLATPLQVAGQVAGNADYFGRPIRIDQKVADQEGIEPDSGLKQVKDMALYVAGQAMPGYGRAVKEKLQGGDNLKVAAQALELPLRFGKKLNPATEAYFKDRDEIYGSLSKNDKAVWDTIHPKLKNIKGEYTTDSTVDSGAARALNYLNNPKILEAENEMSRRAKARGEKTDPLWDLSGQQQRVALRIQSLPPKDPQKDKLVRDNPWYKTLQQQRSAFFDSLPKGDPNKPSGPIDYPEASPQTESLRNAYYQLEDSNLRRQMLEKNPDLAEQFAKEDQYSRAIRAAKDLPQYDKYPEPPADVQKLMDFYTKLPKGEGKNGKSSTRSAWIKSHPNEWQQLTDQWSKQAQWQLQNDAEMANFEGEDLSEKGIKSIASLAKSLGVSTGGQGFAFQKRPPKAGSAYKYAVSPNAGGQPVRPKVSVKKGGGRKTSARAVARPKVTSKRSTV